MIFGFISLLCLLLPSTALASVDVKSEPSATKATTNTWHLSWSVPGSNNSSDAYIRWRLHDGGGSGPLLASTNTGCLSNCGGGQTQSGGSQSMQFTGLADSKRYTVCAELHRFSTSGAETIDTDCSLTRIDVGQPVIAEIIFGGSDPYVTNDNQAVPILIGYRDQVSAPWPANWLKVVLRGPTGAPYHTSDWIHHVPCSKPPLYRGLCSDMTCDSLGHLGWVRYDFSCTFNPNTYASERGLTLQDGFVELNFRTADKAVPDLQDWSNTHAGDANLSEATQDAVTLDRTAPTIVPWASDTTPMVGDTVTFDSSLSVDLPSGLDPSQWLWNWGDGSAGASTVTADHTYSVAGSYVVALSGKDLAGWSGSANLAIKVHGPPGSPENTTPPVITGTPRHGQTLSCSTGTWTGTPSPTLTRQWLRAGSPISEATEATYDAQVADIGQQVACKVTGANDLGTTVVTTAGMAILPAPPRALTAPTVMGTAALGFSLTCNKGTWVGTSPVNFAYQWLRNGVVISGQPAWMYKLTMADTGKRISCRVWASNAAGMVSSASVSRLVTAIKPINTAAPKITGTVKVGQTLACYNGSWTGSTTMTFTRQWYRGTSAIWKATGVKYKALTADKGKRLRCRVVAKNMAGSTAAWSAYTSAVK